MSDFQHSIVLFCGDDGLPLEFNVRNTNEKLLLKSMIEHGGGLCSQSETAVHLISPGTKVLNADLGKKLVSSRYVFDCVKENYLLDVNDYVFTVSESQTSDISDEENEMLITNNLTVVNVSSTKNGTNLKQQNLDIDSVNAIPANSDKKLVISNVGFSPGKTKEMHSNSTASSTESFVEGSIEFNFDPKLTSCVSGMDQIEKPLTSTAKEPITDKIVDNLNQMITDCSPIEASASLVTGEILTMPSVTANSNDPQDVKSADIIEKPCSPLPVQTVVSSSQSAVDDLDQFDNLLLNKIQQKHQSDDESLSQSYTVSSSADAQVVSKPNSIEGNSAEMFDAATSAVPNSPVQGLSLINNRYLYIQKLEPEIERILQKPSPKSIQDKIALVKYICCVQKLPPSVVIASLGSI